ncbi:MAG: urea amidolyase associated protein UAAP1 [Acidimicrobiia bacterium]
MVSGRPDPIPHMTATTHGARDHARSQAETKVLGMPTLPASAAPNLPTGVAPDDVLWDEVLDAGKYSIHELPRASVLRFTDLAGDACAHVALHHADLPSERLNLADTTKVQWQMYLGRGSLLLSDRGRVLAAVTEDSTGRHDTICGAPNQADHNTKYGDGRVEGPYPSARDRLIVALAKFGLGRRDLPPTLAFFKGVRVDSDGNLHLDAVPATAGAFVEVRFELNAIVSVANVPHVLDTREQYNCTPLRLTAWRGDPTGHHDPLRHATPETQRAYANTDDWNLGHDSAGMRNR